MIIFVLIVFVPDIVQDDFYFLREESAEELLIFFLGGLGFIFFLIREKQITSGRKEKSKFQREASRMSKDLNSSYSYIGETNRKIEIMKNIALGLPEWSKMTKEKETEVFNYIISATGILSRSKDVVIRFFEVPEYKLLKEIKSSEKIEFEEQSDICKKCIDSSRSFIETDKYIVAISPHDIDGIKSSIIIKKKKTSHTAEDPDMLRALASQALFLYVFSEKREHMNNNLIKS